MGKYKIIRTQAYVVKPRSTRWQFVAYPLLAITRHDIISAQPHFCLSVNWLWWGIGICITFERK